MSCMKHVGFNVAADPLHIPGILHGSQRRDLSLLLQMIRDFTALRTSRIQEWSLSRAQLPVIEPSDSAEAKNLLHRI